MIRAKSEKEKGVWKRLTGSWQQHEFIHRRELEGLAADEGKEIHVAMRGSGPGRREKCGGGENGVRRSSEKRKKH